MIKNRNGEIRVVVVSGQETPFLKVEKEKIKQKKKMLRYSTRAAASSARLLPRRYAPVLAATATTTVATSPLPSTASFPASSSLGALPTSSLSTSAWRSSSNSVSTPSQRGFSSSSVAAQASPAGSLNSPTETFLTGTSSTYVEDTYEAWLRDPSSVHVSWQIYFKNLSSKSAHPPFIPPPTISPTSLGADGAAQIAEDLVDSIEDHVIPASEILDHMKVQLMVRAYQVRGHQLADLDPLGINIHPSTGAPELDPAHYGFGEKDFDRKFYLGQGILPGFLADEGKRYLTLREIIDRLKKTYCGSIGIEYGHINDRLQCDWLRERFEVPTRYRYTKEQKLLILDRLMWSDSFERFVATKYPSEKRFGLEGCESLIPSMKALIDRSVELGVNSVVMGMPHRGRLNVLSNVVRKPNESIFSEFSGSRDDTVEGSGDVKYHLGMNYMRPTPSGKIVHLSLAANPSHLEAVDPVVQGKVRGLQFYQGDEKDRSKAIAVLLHGDAAFAGQGIVYETFGLSELPAYTTGGSIHIVVNNQVGFTTDPRFSRSTPYCSDVAKTVSAPIIHVNGDDVEAVVYSMELAAEWRARFKKDVVVDVVCYRKHGHNEIDQPGFTQPLMYQRIKEMKPVVEKYIDSLLAEGSVTGEEVKSMRDRVWGILEENYASSSTYKPTSKEWVSSAWSGFKSPAQLADETVASKGTGVEYELLRHLGIAAASYPQGFTVHPNLAKILKAREKSIKDGDGIDWATAESMAFGSLLAENTHVRLSGQDVERGTFSQRHAVLHDQKNEGQYVPLNNIVVAGLVSGQNTFSVSNSNLSEYGTLGFELGYSMVNPNQLVMWEAQFGDFANGAQIIIDQFITPGEQKWLQRNGLTMLLPHGYDGQGPEHSSARIERFLQLCDEDPYRMPDINSLGRGSYARQHQDCNVQVAYPTVPSNYFHLLRRQVHREFRKPLIVFTSKALLRHPMAKSTLLEMGPETRFQRVIPEVLHPNPLADFEPVPPGPEGKIVWSGNNVEPRLPYGLIQDPAHPAIIPDGTSLPASATASSGFTLLPPNEIKTLIFCSGQVYYLLNRARALNNLRHVAIVRLEQLNPFPFWEVKTIIDFYGKDGGALEDVVYTQEEPFNAGSWSFAEPRLSTAMKATDWIKSSGGQKWVEKLARQFTPGGLANGRPNSYTGAQISRSIRGGAFIRYAGRDISAVSVLASRTQVLCLRLSLLCIP
ncbi:thiamine diphosphate-binding protein [Zopfochytrium polystomum]|nr:thiamine diphosphate-binding protein [Zopfochytrium polystomum]